MSDYRAYIIGIDGHRFVRAEFFSNHPDDATAKAAAKKLIDGHDVELWDRNRFVVRFSPGGDEVMLAPQLAA